VMVGGQEEAIEERSLRERSWGYVWKGRNSEGRLLIVLDFAWEGGN